MQDYIKDRCQQIGLYIVEHGATVRQAAAEFCISKSSVHKDMVQRLPQINHQLAAQVARVLEKNMAERHIRGGYATYLKYHKDGEEKAQ